MKKEKFLEILKERLKNELSSREVEYHINYYKKYIEDEIATGKSQEEIIEMLGDPVMIAKTIIDASGNNNQFHNSNMDYNKYNDTKHKGVHFKINGKQVNSLLFKIIIVIITIIVISIIIGIISIAFKILGVLFSIFMPILLVVLVVSIIYKLINR